MPAVPPVRAPGANEDLLSLWGDLEAGLAVILAVPENVQEFSHKVRQYDRWMQALLQEDTDTGLYLLFQMASTSITGYSTSHALVCAALCHLVAPELQLSATERDSLVAAALTMNIQMTALQDQLAEQRTPPGPEQQAAIEAHAARGCMLLARLGVDDELWLDVVASHHESQLPVDDPKHRSSLLAQVLQVTDRYAAVISPRRTRTGRSVTDSLRTVLSGAKGKRAEVVHALVRTVGLCPPGTFVRLDNQELAVVLRRTGRPNQPLVASLTNSHGQTFPHPRLHDTSASPPRVQAAVAEHTVPLHLNHGALVQLGLGQRATVPTTARPPEAGGAGLA